MESKLNRVFRLYHLAKADNPYLYFELAHSRSTGWMSWLINQEGGGREVLVNSQWDDQDDAMAYLKTLEPILIKLENMGYK